MLSKRGMVYTAGTVRQHGVLDSDDEDSDGLPMNDVESRVLIPSEAIVTPEGRRPPTDLENALVTIATSQQQNNRVLGTHYRGRVSLYKLNAFAVVVNAMCLIAIWTAQSRASYAQDWSFGLTNYGFRQEGTASFNMFWALMTSHILNGTTNLLYMLDPGYARRLANETKTGNYLRWVVQVPVVFVTIQVSTLVVLGYTDAQFLTALALGLWMVYAWAADLETTMCGAFKTPFSSTFVRCTVQGVVSVLTLAVWCKGVHELSAGEAGGGLSRHWIQTARLMMFAAFLPHLCVVAFHWAHTSMYEGLFVFLAACVPAVFTTVSLWTLRV